MAAQQQDVDTLKRRGRRRLVGAVALVLLAVIVLPMVFDSEPRNGVPPVSVRIPGEDDTAFTPKVSPRPPEKKSEEKKAADENKAEKADDRKSVAPDRKPAAPSAAEAERARAQAALSGGEFIVPVGAFANPAPVTAKLAGAKVKYYTESVPTSKGSVTRVRAGPFATKAEADKAFETLKTLGFKPGQVSAKSG